MSPLLPFTFPHAAVIASHLPDTHEWRQALEWSHARRSLAKFVYHKVFNAAVGVTIISNLVLLVYQTDQEARCYPIYKGNLDACPFKSNKTLVVLNIAFLVAYSLEIIALVFVERKGYFKKAVNQLDALVIICGWFAELVGAGVNPSFLRVVRIFRLVRAFRLALQYRELYLMIHSILASLKAIGIGTLLLFGMLLVYSIMLVELAHPKNSTLHYPDCAACSDGFSSVGHTVLTLFRTLIAGDSWFVAMPLFRDSWWLAPVVVFVVISITLGVMNLILTVIVERATDARQRDLHALAKAKVASRQELKRALMDLAIHIDENADGQLTVEELSQAFKTSKPFQDLMIALDMQPSELELIMKLADKDCSGSLDYEEFCEELSRYKSFDQSMMLVMTRFNVQQLSMDIEQKVLSSIDRLAEKTRLQESLLMTVNCKVDQLLAPGANDLQAQIKETTCGTSIEHPEKQAQENNSEETCVKTSFEQLHSDIQLMAALSEGLVHQISRQLSTMKRHAEAIATLNKLGTTNVALQCYNEVESNAIPQAHGTELHAALEQLRQNVKLQGGFLMRRAQSEVTVAGAMLDVNSTLLEKLKCTMADLRGISCSVSPLDGQISCFDTASSDTLSI